MNTLASLLQVLQTLRGPGGCPWDQEQTPQSLRPKLLEEAYEVLAVLDQIDQISTLKARPALQQELIEELGDLLLHILLQCEIAREGQLFSFHSVVEALEKKLVTRHPHVFDKTTPQTPPAEGKLSSQEVLKRWEKTKQVTQIQKNSSKGLLDGLPIALPALQRASQIIDRVSRAGFEWPGLSTGLKKVEEEWQEFLAELPPTGLQAASLPVAQQARLEAELGDVFFSLCHLARQLKLDPEQALKDQNQRFAKRFRHVEWRASLEGQPLSDTPLATLDTFWKEAKLLEKTTIYGLTGGIAAGKSTVAKFLEAEGIAVIDADAIAQELLEKDKLLGEQVWKAFQTYHPHELKQKIFEDATARKQLEDLLHPVIARRSLEQMLSLALHHPVIVYQAPLLVQTGRFRLLDGLWVVTAPVVLRQERLKMRNPELSQALINGIFAAQLPEEELLAHATEVFPNEGSLKDLEASISAFVRQRWPQLLHSSSRG